MLHKFNKQKVLNFNTHIKIDPTNGFNSWKYCYEAFSDIKQNEKLLALHLGFYLASWGMYRGSAAISQKDYTIHIKTVHIIREFYDLRCNETNEVDKTNAFRIYNLTQSLFNHYNGLQYMSNNVLVDRKPTDTLISKIIIGTLGCSPAFDRYFIDGTKVNGFGFYNMKLKSYEELFQFIEEYKTELTQLQKELYKIDAIHYPLLKIVDMYFWHEGFSIKK